MRTPPELTELPFSYWQLGPLSESQFIKEAKEREVFLSAASIQGLHRVGLLVPFLRFKRDGRAIAAAAKRKEPYVWEFAGQTPYRRETLREAYREGRLFDPGQEGFVSRRRLDREASGIPYRSSEFFYSHHQLLSLSWLGDAVAMLRYGRGGEVSGINLDRLGLDRWRGAAIADRELAIVLSALEPLHYPAVIGRVRYNGDELEERRRWGEGLKVGELIGWLGIDAKWLSKRAERLLSEADRIDPLGPWVELVREANPKSWEKLKGDARKAIDLRIGAEILLLQYEELARARRAPALKEPEGRWHNPMRWRLRPTGQIDRSLTALGVSPHPRLVLVVEGDTEHLLLPRVMDHFGVRLDREYIALENARGVDRDLSALIAFAISPRVQVDATGPYLKLSRPPTRFFAVMDAEGKYKIAEKREQERKKLIDRVMLTFPAKHRTAAVRASIESLISITTWDSHGQSFEFANFTDLQIAKAIGEVKPRGRQGLEQRRQMVANLRTQQGNLKKMLGRVSKLDLAEALWPVLERRIARAQAHGTEARIPVVRVLREALQVAEGTREKTW
jgi:hypothetical protein